MLYEFPKGFFEGKTVIHVGTNLEEFLHICHNDPRFNDLYCYRNKPAIIEHMLKEFGDKLTISCNYFSKGLCHDDILFYKGDGAKIHEFVSTPNDCSDLLNLL